MRKSILALGLAGTVTLSACATNPAVTRDAAIGGVGGAAVGAVVPGVSVIEGAAVGAAIGGLAGAVWTDNNNDGYVDGYVYNGQYYAGTPQGYDPTTHSVLGSAATGALGGAALGAVAGAVLPGVSVLRCSDRRGGRRSRRRSLGRPQQRRQGRRLRLQRPILCRCAATAPWRRRRRRLTPLRRGVANAAKARFQTE